VCAPILHIRRIGSLLISRAAGSAFNNFNGTRAAFLMTLPVCSFSRLLLKDVK